VADKEVFIFVIDDDTSVRKSLSSLLKSAGYKVETFASAGEFLSQASLNSIGCILLDVRMRGMTGLDLQEHLVSHECHMPIIFMTGHGDIPMSVKAIKKGAVDFLTKPFDDIQLLSAIESAVGQYRRDKAGLDEIRDFRQRLKTLTPREHDVFLHVISGLLNKQIADELTIKEHTVKVHRGRIMQKLCLDSLAELVRLAEKANISIKAPHRTKV
jgi:two-component system, LuxR family, response regulator FixJ